MPRRPKIKDEVKAACYKAWETKRALILNKSVTVKDVYEKDLPTFLAQWDQKDWPQLSWFTKKIKYEWEPNAPTESLKPDPVVEHWDEKWWKSPRRIFVLTTLYDQASLAFLSHRSDTGSLDTPPREFVGFTDRVCKWAWKLSEFFDLNVSRECYLLILIANLFAYEERHEPSHPDGDLPLEAMWSVALGREQLVAWQRHKMGYEPDDSSHDVKLWQVSEEELRKAMVTIGSEGQVLVLADVGGSPTFIAVIE
jgi:hypothetical protein